MGAPRSLERPTEGTRAPPAPRTDLLDYRSHVVGGRLPEARVLGQDRASSYKAERGQAAKDDSSSRCSQGGAGGSRLRSPPASAQLTAGAVHSGNTTLVLMRERRCVGRKGKRGFPLQSPPSM